MSVLKKATKNVSYLLAARSAFRFLTALVVIYIGRYLDQDQYGSYETALAWSNTFLAINDLGMSTLIVREAARDEEKMAVYFGNTLIVEVFLSLILFCLVMGIGFWAQYDSLTLSLMAILGAAGLIYEFRKVMRGIFRVLMNLRMVAILEVINGALYLGMTVLIIASITDLNLGALALGHARLWVNVAVVIALLLYTLKFVKPKFDFAQIPAMVKQSYVFTLYNMFFMLYFQVDQIVISLMLDESAVAVYSAASKPAAVLLFIPLMIFQVSMPLMYKYSKDELPKYKRVNNFVWRMMSAFGIPAGIGLALLATETLTLLYDDKYLDSIPTMQLLGLFLAIRFVGITQGNSLTTTDRQGLRALIQILSVGVNIILDVILIPIYGPLGAGIATVITETIISGSYLIYSARFLNESLFRNALQLLPSILAALLMTAFVWLAKPYLHVILVIIIAAALYAILLWLFRFFTPYDIKILKEIIRKKKT